MQFYWLIGLKCGEGSHVDANTVEQVPNVQIRYINWVLETDGVYENSDWRVEFEEMPKPDIRCYGH